MSISPSDFNLKLWNISLLLSAILYKNYECILNIKTINVKGHILLGCFLKENSNVYIFDLNDNKIKDIKNYFTFFIDTYYDKKLFKNYIITSYLGFVTSYDYTNGKYIINIYPMIEVNILVLL